VERQCEAWRSRWGREAQQLTVAPWAVAQEVYNHGDDLIFGPSGSAPIQDYTEYSLFFIRMTAYENGNLSLAGEVGVSGCLGACLGGKAQLNPFAGEMADLFVVKGEYGRGLGLELVGIGAQLRQVVGGGTDGYTYWETDNLTFAMFGYNDPQKLDHRLRCFFDIILETCGEIEMAKKRRTHSNQFKFKVALEAAQELRTRNEIASQHGLHPNQVGKWKKQLLAEGPTVFDNNTAQQLEAVAEREAELYEQIGRLKMELEWLKKKAAQFS
jgi:transposase